MEGTTGVLYPSRALEMARDTPKWMSHPRPVLGLNYIVSCRFQDAVSGYNLGFAFVEYATAEIAEEVVRNAAQQAADARSVKSWRKAPENVQCCMKADWDGRRKKGKKAERREKEKKDRKDKQDAKAALRLSSEVQAASLEGSPESAANEGETSSEKEKKKKNKKEKKNASEAVATPGAPPATAEEATGKKKKKGRTGDNNSNNSDDCGRATTPPEGSTAPE